MPPTKTSPASNQSGIIPDLSLIFSCLFVLALATLWSLDLDEPFSHDYDEGVYLCSARMVLHGHPLFAEVFSSQPPAFLKILTWAFWLFGDTVVVGRAVIVFFAVVSLGATGWIAWHMACPLAAPAAILCLGLSLTFFRQANMVEAEIPALGLALMGLALPLAPSNKHWQVRLAAAGFCFCAGALCKLLVVPMALPLALLLLPSGQPQSATGSNTMKAAASRQKASLPLLLAARVLFFCLGSAAALILFCWPENLAALYDQAVTFHVQAKIHHPSDWSANAETIGRLLEAEPALPLLAIPGLLCLYARLNYSAVVLHLWLLAAAVFLLDHAPLFQRHVMLLLPPLAVTASANAVWLSLLLKRRYGRLCAPLFLLAFPWCLSSSLKKDLELLSRKPLFSDIEAHVVRLTEQHTEPADYVVSDEQMQVFRAGRQTPPQLCDTSFVRIRSGYLTDDEAIKASAGARMIIFKTGRLSQLSRYARWVTANYRLLGSFGQSRVYIRVGAPR